MSVFCRFRVAAGIFLTAAAPLSAFDLTLKSGEVISGVSIAGISPEGVRVCWPEGESRFIRFDLLSPASLKTLSDFSSPLSNSSAGAGNEAEDPTPVLPGTVGNVYFHSVRVLQGGTLGWAESAGNGTGAAPTQFGKVYISGLFIPQGNVWTGRAYPTKARIRHLDKSYPCWALSPSAARQITAAEE